MGFGGEFFFLSQRRRDAENGEEKGEDKARAFGWEFFLVII